MDCLVLSSDATGNAILWSLNSRTQITSFKDASTVTRGTAVVLGSRDDGRIHADGFVACQSARSFVHMFSIAKVCRVFRQGIPPTDALL